MVDYPRSRGLHRLRAMCRGLPAGALNVDGFRPLVPETAGGGSCSNAGAWLSAIMIRKPSFACLGSLTAQDLMEAAGSGTAIVVVDHGWCAACPVSHSADPWGAALSETAALLSTVSAQLAGAVGVEQRVLARDRAQPVMAALRPDKQVGRRDVLRRLTGTTERRDSLAESQRVIAGRGLVRADQTQETSDADQCSRRVPRPADAARADAGGQDY